jgi:ribosomal protein L32
MNTATPTFLDTDYASLRPLALTAAVLDRPFHICAKTTYPTKRDALTALNFRMRRNPYHHKRPAFLRVYSCPACGGWHLTHRELFTD